MFQLLFIVVAFVIWTEDINALTCAQCNGVHGFYPNNDYVSSCDNLNNACQTSNFCLKIVDPIKKSKHYTTFKSDCYYSSTISSQYNSSPILSGKCYPYNDGGNPPKQYLYCFCNNRDYCNSALKSTSWPVLVVLTLIAPFYSL